MKINEFAIYYYKCVKGLFVNCRGTGGVIKQWTVLLGENNTGKTNVLRALALLRPVKVKVKAEIDTDATAVLTS